jgi:signal transduction histidine kinase
MATLQSVLEDIRNLNKLSNSLLDLAKASSDPSSIHLQPLRIDEVLWETSEELTGVKNDYHVDIRFLKTIDDDRELMVFGNRHLLKTAFINLMDNGCKFSPDKTVNVSIDSQDQQISLAFSDKGIGIDKEDLANLTEPFFRAKNAGTFQGSGLGISLVYKIIRLHKGSLDFASTPNEGTTVTVSIPVMLLPGTRPA